MLNEVLYELKVINIVPKYDSGLSVLNFVVGDTLIFIDSMIFMKIYLRSLASMKKFKA